MTRETLDQLHPEGLSELQERLALRWYEIGVVRINFETGWMLAAGEWSPIYVDGRLIQSDPEAKMQTLHLVLGIAKNLQHDLIAGVPTEAIALGSSYFDATGKPQITPRIDKKTHGRGRKVDGIYHEGQVALLLEGTTTTGGSMSYARELLTGENLIVRDAIAVCDREQGAEELLMQYGTKLHSVLKLPEVLPFYARLGLITSKQLNRVLEYLHPPR